MESLIRCDNGHYYDAKKHRSCPFCGVQDLDLDIKKTMAKRSEQATAASMPTGAAGQGAPAPQGDAAKTVGIFKRKMGIDPCVGWLVAVQGPTKGQDYRITAERNFIGRSETMDISITEDESIARDNHAIISYNPKNNTYRLFPGDSKRLVYLNDEEVIAPEVLKLHDRIELGETVMLFVPFCDENFQW